MTATDMDRFLAKVERTPSCWIWRAAATPKGYGSFWVNGRLQYAHRFAYEAFVGPILDGLQIDHLCRNPRCVNPAHLEPVTPRTNTLRSPIAPTALNARKTHCKRGHEFTPQNIEWQGRKRSCRTCRNDRRRKGAPRPESRSAARRWAS